MLLPEQTQKLDPSDDTLFYAYPRFVTHVDEGFIDRLTELYRVELQPNTRILDLMSSWVSHLPEEIKFAHLEGHGMNEEELAKNSRLDHYFVQDLNQNPVFPFPDQEFDAILNCVSIQYLQKPDRIFAEMYRTLKPGGKAIVSFSNRMFFQKAIAAWREGTEQSRVQLVKRYFRSVEGFSDPKLVMEKPNISPLLQLLGIGVSDPFYAMIAQKIINN